MHRYLVGLAFSLQTMLIPPLGAQTSIGSIKERAAYLKEVKALLQDEDSDTRLAAFEEGMRADDPNLRSLTMEAALGGDDERLQTAALRHLFTNRTSFIANIEMPEHPSDAEKAMYLGLEFLELNNIELNQENDELNIKYWRGHLVRGGVTLRGTSSYTKHCKLTARVATGTTMVGAVECNDKKAGLGELPITIELS